MGLGGAACGLLASQLQRAAKLSWHSFRVWLACALLATGATPEQIMLLLRWSSEEARKLYARMGVGVSAALVAAAPGAVVDSVRSHTLATTRAAATAGDIERQAREALADAERLLGGAAGHRGALPAVAALPEIDDDARFARLHAEGDLLATAAARADAALSRLDAEEVEDDE